MDSVNVPWLFTMGVSTFGNPRIEAYLQLPAAYRSLSRPSSAPDAKAFTLCSCSLELLADFSVIWFSHYILELLEFLKHWLFAAKRHSSFLPYPPFGEIVVRSRERFTLDWKDLFLVASI